MKQKTMGFLVAVMVASAGMALVVPTGVEAETPWQLAPEKMLTEAQKGGLGGGNCGVSGFLGLRPWYYGLCTGNTKDDRVKEPSGPTAEADMKAFVWTIVLNILMDLLVIAGYASMILIIYGGYQFMMSQGDPGKTMSGKKTLTSAIIGMIICLSASVLVNTGMVILSINSAGGDLSKIGNNFKQEQIQNAFTWAYTVAGLVAVGFIINGGVKYILSRGDPGRSRAATQAILYAVIGLGVVLMAAAITMMVTKSVSGTPFN